MDIQSRERWVEYSKAKDEMFRTPTSSRRPGTSSKATTRSGPGSTCIRHLLELVPYRDLTPDPIILPPRQRDDGYVRPPLEEQTFIPQVY